ncbi:MAG: beta-galactosidase [Gemmataceae bacterium]
MKALWAVVFVAVSLGAIGAARGVETVRVDVGGGAPRLLVDGKPVRARVFWGAPGTRPLRVGPTPQVVSFEFTPPADEPARATMHFRFGQAPGELVLDDIEVTDLTAGGAVFPKADFEGGADSFARSWTFWPTGAANTVGAVRVEKGVGRDGSAGLKVTLKAPPGDHWPDFHLYHLPRLALHKGHRYRVRFWARASTPRELTVAFYRPGDTFVFLGGPGGVFEAQIRLAAAAGVDLVSFPVDLPWPPPGRPVDWSTADAQCQTVLDANPKALLMPRIGVDPPAWWLKAHPDDAMRWDDGKHERPVAVVVSPVYRRDAAERLAALVAHLEEKFGPHVAGYHPCGQNTGEWFYQDTWLNGLNGYAPADERAWRRWLAGRYPDDAARKNTAIPSPAARRAARPGYSTTRRPSALIDFAAFQQEAMADCVCHLAAAVRKASRGRKLVLFFYGYGFEFGAHPPRRVHFRALRSAARPELS